MTAADNVLTGVALVTGGGGGLGRAIAVRLRAEGMQVVTSDLPGRGGDIDANVTDAAAMTALAAAIVAEHGSLDIVVANAGIGVAGLAELVPAEAWVRSTDVNIQGAVNTLLAVYPGMIERRRGHLVFMASLAGLGATPLMTPYAMTKFAVIGLATSLRPEAARHGIGVTVVCPGPVDTDLLDSGGAAGHVAGGVNIRRYLTDVAGKPLSADSVARATLRGVRRNRAVVTPGRAGLLWRLARLSPGLLERASAAGMAKELRKH